MTNLKRLLAVVILMTATSAYAGDEPFERKVAIDTCLPLIAVRAAWCFDDVGLMLLEYKRIKKLERSIDTAKDEVQAMKLRQQRDLLIDYRDWFVYEWLPRHIAIPDKW